MENLKTLIEIRNREIEQWQQKYANIEDGNLQEFQIQLNEKEMLINRLNEQINQLTFA